MYIESIAIRNFRCFREAHVEFVYRGRAPSNELPAANRFPNINLLIGNNGLGKTTLLKAIALTALGPAVEGSGIFPYRLIRREPDQTPDREGQPPAGPSESVATLAASFRPHPQDETPYDPIESRVAVSRRGDLEQLRWTHPDDAAWDPIFSSSSNAFFFVGYGATRRVEKREQTDIATRRQSAFVRAQRVQSLFEESYSLLPLSAWLPSYRSQHPARYDEVVRLIDDLLRDGHYRLTGDLEDNEYVFSRGDLKVPFPALSDGYRAYLGWICDLLYHVCATCPADTRLIDNRGIVMIDEIDLHIHPRWQIDLLPTLARALPNIQFIVTSHSPLVAGSLEWTNIVLMDPAPMQSSRPKRIREPIHGLDADQVLLTDYFGMKSTRAAVKDKRLQRLTEEARAGNAAAAKQLLEEMTKGLDRNL